MRNSTGFSLIELMVTLAVAAVLIGLATPSLSQFMRNNQLAAGTNNLVLALQVARAEAIRRGQPVTLCSSTNPAAATIACSGSTSWGGDDMVLVIDGARSGAASPGELVQVFGTDDVNLAITAPNSFIRFLPSGEVQTGSALEVVFELAPGICQGDQRSRVSLNRMGRVRTQRMTCS